MGNSNGPQMLYNPSGGVVMDIESANIKSAQLNRKSERSISPLPSNNHIVIDDHTKKTSKKEKDPRKKYSIILENLTKNQELYSDMEFAAELNNISPNISHFLPTVQQSQIFWVRSSEIFPNCSIQLFKDSIIPNDIQQGLLGDCYFLSAIAALAERPSFVLRLFESNEYNSQGCYSIWLCIDGEWKNVILDDFFPVSRKDVNSVPSLLFSRSNGPELWVLLLEKAYSKINKCYQNIESGLCEEALRDLTGAPTLTLTDFNEEEAWEFMKTGNQKKFLLVVSSQFEKKEGKTGGLISGHCYSVLDIREVKSNDGKERLIQIRNPWGHKEWTGDWSDDSNKWTEDLRKDLKWEKKDDGIFWMNCKDFCAYYSEITVCQVHENFQYSSLRINFSDVRHKFLTFQVKKENDGPTYFTISQMDKRKMDNNHGYSYVRIILCKFEKNEVFLIEENTGKNRDLCLTCEKLPIGVYVVFCEIESPNDTKNENNKISMVFSSYTSFLVEFSEIKVEKSEFFQNLSTNFVKSHLKIHEKTTQRYEDTGKIQRMTSRIADYLFICYFNEADYYTLQENVEFVENSNLLTIDNKPIEKKVEVIVKPQSKFTLSFKSTLDSQTSYASFKFQGSSILIWNADMEKMAEEALKKPMKVLQRKINEQIIEVFVNVFYKCGILGFLFRNEMEKNSYKEVLVFKTKNLKAKNFDPNSLVINLPSKGSLFIIFEVEDQSSEVYYKMNYVPIVF